MVRTRVRGWLAMAFVAASLLASCAGPGGLQEAVCDLTLTDDTVYAQRYSDRQFAAVTEGMSEEEVLRRLGPPIDDPWMPQGTDAWDRGMRWSRSASDSNYKVRVVHFRDGRVTKKVAEFYVD